MEKWDLYTADRKKTGEIHTRGDALPDDRYHLVVHVWIRNSAGEYLISQRAANRRSFPLMWECTGGSVLMGETSLEGAIREAKEEIGADLDPSKGYLVLSEVRGVVKGERFNDIMDAWLFEYDGDITLDRATTDEVETARWLSVEQIRELMDNGVFVDTLEYFFTKIAKAQVI